MSVYETKGDLSINEGVFESVDTKFYFLSDDFESKEIKGQLDSKLNLELFNSPIKTSVGLDFLKGSFAQNFIQENALKLWEFTSVNFPKLQLKSFRF